MLSAAPSHARAPLLANCLPRPKEYHLDLYDLVGWQHAKWLSDAGFDYIVIDVTNWPVTGVIGGPTDVPSVDMTIIRPIEVLAEEWLALRAEGIRTPSITVWPTAQCGTDTCAGGATGPHYAMWRWVLDQVCCARITVWALHAQ